MYNLTPQELALTAVYTFGAMQKPEELAPLIDLVTKAQPRVIVEIGTGKGGTAWAWSKIPGVKKLILIDMPNGPFGGSDSKEVQAKLEFIGASTPAKVYYIAGSSQNSECLAELNKILGGSSIDFLYIDGDHTYNGVKTDFMTYSPLVSKPGLIAMHDISWHDPASGCEVQKFWEEIKASGIPEDQYSTFELKTEPSWGGNGIVRW